MNCLKCDVNMASEGYIQDSIQLCHKCYEIEFSEERECELCGSRSWRILHEGDESNCECEGECLRVCDNPSLSDEGCDGVAYLIKEREGK